MSEQRRRLARKLVEAASPGPADRFLWDSEVVGLGLKINAGGARSYVVQYRFEGRPRRYTIGRHGSPWTVETARDEARKLLGGLAAGVDPQTEKAGARRAVTVGELCDLYVAERLATAKPLAVAAARCDIDNHIKPLLGARRAAQLRPEDVDRFLVDVAEGKTARRAKTGKARGLSRVRGGKGAANSSVRVLCAALNFGIRRGVRGDNPALGVRKYRERKIDRFLSAQELARLGETLAAAESLGVESPFAIAALRLLILTGCRKNEILKLERAWVDRENACLRLSDSKTGAKVVHIGAAALAVIDSVLVVEGSRYLLPGRIADRPIADLQSAWERLRDAAGLSDVRLHDLRHAFASLGAAQGDSLLIIGALLGHKSARTTERYAHLADHPKKDAADRISGEVARLLGLNAAPAGPRNGRAAPAEPPPGTRGLLGEVIDTRWLDTPAAARHLRTTVGTLQTYRWMGTGPRFRKIGRRVVYALGDLEAWRAERGTPAPAPASSAVAAAPNVVLLSGRRAASV